MEVKCSKEQQLYLVKQLEQNKDKKQEVHHLDEGIKKALGLIGY